MSGADEESKMEKIGPVIERIEGARNIRVRVPSIIKMNLHTYKGFIPLLRELLQNSDDSLSGEDSLDNQSVNVKIVFEKDRLRFINNTIFTAEDWDRIGEIASFNKATDDHKTGRFGVGFTSVYQICDRLCIHSNNNSGTIDLNKDVENPQLEHIDVKYPEEKITEFEFFWRKEKSRASIFYKTQVFSDTEIADIIKRTCDGTADLVYYLKNITSILIYEHITSKTPKLLKRVDISKKVEELDGFKKETRTYNFFGRVEKRLLFHMDITSDFGEEYEEGIARRRPLLLTIGVDPNSRGNGRIYCTLPTDAASGFPFDIDSDFYPDTSRTRIHLQDREAKYNLKIIDHVDDLLYKAIGELKKDLSVEAFYDTISQQDSSRWSKDEAPLKEQCYIVYNRFKEKLRADNFPVIAVDGEWRPPSSVRLLDEHDILPFLKKAGMMIVPEKHMKYIALFKALEVPHFQVNEMLSLFRERINSGTRLSESIFEGDRKLLGTVYRYVEAQINSNNNVVNQAIYAPLYLTEKEVFVSPAKVNIYQMPQELLPLASPLGVEIIDPKLKRDHQGLFDLLGVKVYGPFEMLMHLIDDSRKGAFPAEMARCPAYMNDKKKLKAVLRFIDPLLSDIIKEHENFEKKYNAQINGFQVKANSIEYNRYSFISSKYCDIPIVLDEEGRVHTLGDRTVCYLDSNEKKRRLAGALGIVGLDDWIKEFAAINLTVPRFKLGVIFSFLKEKQELNDETLLLIYQVVNEEKKELQSSAALKNELMGIRIFDLSNGERTSLRSSDPPLLKGDYSDPLGVSNIIDERLISRVNRFKEYILIDVCGIKELQFSVYVIKYYPAIFDNDRIEKDVKLKLIKELDDNFNRMMESPDNAEISRTLRSSRIAYCEDGVFRRPSEPGVFIRTENVETFLSGGYHWLNFPDNERYRYMFSQLGVKDKVDIKDIIEHVKTIAGQKADPALVEKAKKLFVVLNDSLDDFEKDRRIQLRALRDAAWLPAGEETGRLCKPTELYTQVSKDRLYARALTEHLPNIKYLDIKEGDFKRYNKPVWIKNELIEHLGLVDEAKTPTEQILLNLEIATQGHLKLSRRNTIYTELERRIKEKKIDRRNLDRLAKIKCFYDDKADRYFGCDEVFTNNVKMEYLLTEYVHFLDHTYSVNYPNLLAALGVKDDPTPQTYALILKKIQDKYADQGDTVSDENDRIIVDNCLEELDKAKLEPMLVEQLRYQKIVVNHDGRLLQPKDAIIIDRPDLQDELPPQINAYTVKVSLGTAHLYEQLKIVRLSKIFGKHMDKTPDTSAREDEKATGLISNLREVMKRVMAHKLLEKDGWTQFHADAKVYINNGLRVRRYVTYHDREYEIGNPDNDNYPVYVDSQKGWIKAVYLKYPLTRDSSTLYRLSHDICDALHPDLDRDFAIVLKALLSCGSVQAMHDELTGAKYMENEDSRAGRIPEAKKLESIGGAEGPEEGPVPTVSPDHEPKVEDTPEKKPIGKQGATRPPEDPRAIRDRQTEEKGTSRPSRRPPVTYKPVPLSLEEEKERRETIRNLLTQAVNDEHEQKRAIIYVDSTDDEEKKGLTREDMLVWYQGKCQVCGSTFDQRNGSKYFEVIYINKLNQFGGGGYVFPGNALCLCAEHAARWQHGEVEKFDPEKIDDGKLEMLICGKKEIIRINEEHKRYMDVYWNVEFPEDA